MPGLTALTMGRIENLFKLGNKVLKAIDYAYAMHMLAYASTATVRAVNGKNPSCSEGDSAFG